MYKLAFDASSDEIEVIKKLNNKTSLFKLIKFVDERLRKDIELFDYINEDNIETATTAATATATTITTTTTTATTSGDGNKSVQHQSAVNFLQSVFSWFGYFILKSYQPINEQVFSLLPQVIKTY